MGNYTSSTAKDNDASPDSTTQPCDNPTASQSSSNDPPTEPIKRSADQISETLADESNNSDNNDSSLQQRATKVPRKGGIVLLQAKDAPKMLQELRQLGRRLVLSTIEHCSSDAALHRLWQELEPKHRIDNEIVYKFLGCCGNRLFGNNPFFRIARRRDRALLSGKFLSDPKAILAFLTNKPYLCWDFGFPRCIGDNKQVMMVVCAKESRLFERASERLRDDAELVQVVLRTGDARIIPLVSERLRKDKNMLLYLISKGRITEKTFGSEWLSHLEQFSDEQGDTQKEIAQELCRYLAKSSFPWLGLLGHFSQALRDDMDFMMPFVAAHWTALQWCSDRLRRDSAMVTLAVSQSSNAYEYVEGPIRQEYEVKRGVDFVVQELNEKELDFRNVPANLKANKAIILAALKSHALGPWVFADESLRSDKKFILDVIEIWDDIAGRGGYNLYSNLDERLQADENMAMAFLQAGYHDSRARIFTAVPSLLRSRDAMMAALKNFDHEPPDEMLRSTFFDDAGFMLEAYESVPSSIEHASARLLSDRLFLDRVLAMERINKATNGYSNVFIHYTMGVFEESNPYFIAEAIGILGRSDDWVLEHLTEDLIWGRQETRTYPISHTHAHKMQSFETKDYK